MEEENEWFLIATIKKLLPLKDLFWEFEISLNEEFVDK